MQSRSVYTCRAILYTHAEPFCAHMQSRSLKYTHAEPFRAHMQSHCALLMTFTRDREGVKLALTNAGGGQQHRPLLLARAVGQL